MKMKQTHNFLKSTKKIKANNFVSRSFSLL